MWLPDIPLCGCSMDLNGEILDYFWGGAFGWASRACSFPDKSNSRRADLVPPAMAMEDRGGYATNVTAPDLKPPPEVAAPHSAPDEM